MFFKNYFKIEYFYYLDGKIFFLLVTLDNLGTHKPFPLDLIINMDYKKTK